MSSDKYMPVRTCIGCGKKGAKNEFIRIAKTKDGIVFVNAGKDVFGRSAYICSDEKCVLKAVKKNRILRTLRISDGGGIYQKLLKIIGDKNGQDF